MKGRKFKIDHLNYSVSGVVNPKTFDLRITMVKFPDGMDFADVFDGNFWGSDSEYYEMKDKAIEKVGLSEKYSKYLDDLCNEKT